MTRRGRARGWALRAGPLAALLAAALVSAAGTALLWRRAPASPERIVLIVVDTLRRDYLGCYGGSASTPHLDALAARGQRFEHALASFHQTSMSMAALFTGRTPSIESEDVAQPLEWNGSTWCGLARFAPRAGEGRCIPDTLTTLAERLRSAGYWTIGVAANQFLFEPSGFSRGFDDWSEVGDKPAPEAGPLAGFDAPAAMRARTWQHVNRAAADALARRASDRFFLYVHYMDVHDHDGSRASYARSTEAVDGAVGHLLDSLARADLLEGAVLIVTSDHGERLGEPHHLPGNRGHLGNPTFREHLEIPLLIAPATQLDPVRPLRSQDLFHLIQQIAGRAEVRDDSLERDELYVTEQRFRTYLRGRWKSSLRRDDGALFLFDLASDPAERRNLAERRPQVAAAHRARIQQLGVRLAAPGALRRERDPAERARLRALGYLESGEASAP